MNSINNKDLKVQNITSVECYNKLSEISISYLIDVRTKPEWELIGVPDLSSLNKKTIFIAWNEYPEMNINKNFIDQVAGVNIEKNDNIFLLCRSGRRSFHAAMYLVSCGYKHSYNVSDGFEGDKNELNQRSTINGWKYNNLPWQQ
jgi:rhodanese-related sulfurtransferase|tara:strand:- start:265 stop:699 length:435 start_codon:yes stop_codon:yes gene_type:complete